MLLSERGICDISFEWVRIAQSVKIIFVAFIWAEDFAANIAEENIVSASAASYTTWKKTAPRYTVRSVASSQSATASIWARLTEETLIFYRDTVSIIISSRVAYTRTRSQSS